MISIRGSVALALQQMRGLPLVGMHSTLDMISFLFGRYRSEPPEARRFMAPVVLQAECDWVLARPGSDPVRSRDQARVTELIQEYRHMNHSELRVRGVDVSKHGRLLLSFKGDGTLCLQPKRQRLDCWRVMWAKGGSVYFYQGSFGVREANPSMWEKLLRVLAQPDH